MVRKGFILVLGIILAVALYSLLGQLNPGLVVLVNTFSIWVMFVAITYGELDGAIMGTCAGLVQDAFTYGIFGLAGLSQTVSGFLAGLLSRKLELGTFYKRTFFIFFFSLLQVMIWLFFFSIIFRKGVFLGHPLLYLQPVVTALLSSALISLLKKIKWVS